MFKKIFFKTVFAYFLLVKIVHATESGGMPQLDPEFWFSQIFWLVITFGILYLVLSKLILPKISENLETRKSQILDNLELAEKQRNQSEAKLKEFDNIILKSKIDAKNLYNEARNKLLNDIDKKRKHLEEKIEKEVKKNKVKKMEKSTLIGEILAKRAKEKKITEVYFDRGEYKYHGRIKVFAETLRKNGLKF